MPSQLGVIGCCGCIFRLIPKTDDSTESLPFSLDGLLASHEDDFTLVGSSINDYVLVPVEFDGSRWTSIFETSQSSTWGERAAAMLIVHKKRKRCQVKLLVSVTTRIIKILGVTPKHLHLLILAFRFCTAFLTYIGDLS